MSGHNQNVWGIILAGGEGKRLQPFIRSQYGADVPKQFCTFTGTRSMLRHTIDRAEMLIPPERLLTIVSKHHLGFAERQLGDRVPRTVVVQPFNRETGLGILYPLLHVYQRDPEATVCLFPSDHFILNEQNFMKHVGFSTQFVASHPQSVVLLGVKPQKPEGEYGWIVTGEQLVNNDGRRVHEVSRFVEKPDAFTAYHLYQSGYLWNSMVIVCRAKRLLSLFKMFTPAAYQALFGIRNVFGTSLEAPAVEAVYSRVSPVNFSYAVLGNTPAGLATLCVHDAYWSDWGDAARIQSDIRLFCSPDGAQHDVASARAPLAVAV